MAAKILACALAAVPVTISSIFSGYYWGMMDQANNYDWLVQIPKLGGD